MIASRVISALAVLSVAAAQSASICEQATATINSQADATQYADCSTIEGDVLIGPSASGEIILDGPRTIEGSLIARNAGNLVTFGSPSLARITEKFELVNLTTLTTLSMGQLTEVEEIDWNALPQLSVLTFTQDIKQASKVVITNTFLSTLNGINLNTVDELDINNNIRLREFSTQLGNVTQSVNIDANNRDLEVSFPNLLWAANMTFRNVSSVSIPSLESVNGSLGFYGNYFTDLQAPNLTSVGSSLAFVGNAFLENVTLPLLTRVGGANQIANNSALTDISFPVLANVGGAIDFSGNFSTPELPDLEDVRGGFNMQSTAEIDCSPFEELEGNVIQGVFTCKTTADAKSGLNADGTTSGDSDSDSDSDNEGAAMSFGPNAVLAGLSVVGGLIAML
jgi:hypothetical protein